MRWVVQLVGMVDGCGGLARLVSVVLVWQVGVSGWRCGLVHLVGVVGGCAAQDGELNVFLIRNGA
jgi:hypothetical protein